MPVGCVFVHNGEVIGSGRNRTNESLNVGQLELLLSKRKLISNNTLFKFIQGTRHAEFEGIDMILNSSSTPKRDPSIFKETDLYVTVEPCIMCSSALRQLGIRKVYFGCRNERFGGCGTVLPIHDDERITDCQPYPIEVGIFREEAIMMLRKFYLRENESAPVPKKKSGRVLKTEVN